jgi:phosphoglycerate kinase
LPTDVVVADAFSAEANHKTVPVSGVESGWRAMDIGPDTLSTFRDALDDCATIFWNGPLGVAEFPAFAEGSLALALALADLDSRVVIGGGETSAIVEQAGLHDRYAHVSTGGGASLEFIEGKAAGVITPARQVAARIGSCRPRHLRLRRRPDAEAGSDAISLVFSRSWESL